jgi:hypothetical protein
MQYRIIHLVGLVVVAAMALRFPLVLGIIGFLLFGNHFGRAFGFCYHRRRRVVCVTFGIPRANLKWV